MRQFLWVSMIRRGEGLIEKHYDRTSLPDMMAYKQETAGADILCTRFKGKALPASQVQKAVELRRQALRWWQDARRISP